MKVQKDNQNKELVMCVGDEINQYTALTNCHERYLDLITIYDSDYLLTRDETKKGRPIVVREITKDIGDVSTYGVFANQQKSPTCRVLENRLNSEQARKILTSDELVVPYLQDLLDSVAKHYKFQRIILTRPQDTYKFLDKSRPSCVTSVPDDLFQYYKKLLDQASLMSKLELAELAIAKGRLHIGRL